MSGTGALQVVQLINALLLTVRELGLSWKAVSEQIAQAQAEGREFSAADLRVSVQRVRASLDTLEASIEARKAVENQ